MNITIHRDGQNYGPYSFGDIRQYLASGSLALTDLAFIEGASEWTTLGQVPGIATSTPPPPPSTVVSSTLPAHDFSNLRPYYQNRFKKIEDSNEQHPLSWNWAAFFFSFIWAYSKGLYKNATFILIILLVFAALVTDSDAIARAEGIALSFYYGYRGNWLYYNKVKYKKQLWI